MKVMSIPPTVPNISPNLVKKKCRQKNMMNAIFDRLNNHSIPVFNENNTSKNDEIHLKKN